MYSTHLPLGNLNKILDTVNRGNFETRGNFVLLQKRVLRSFNHLAVSYSQCPSKAKVFYKVSSSINKNKKAFSESFIEFVSTVITGRQNQISVRVQNMFITKNRPLLWTLIVAIQYQNVIF